MKSQGPTPTSTRARLKLLWVDDGATRCAAHLGCLPYIDVEFGVNVLAERHRRLKGAA